MKFCVQCQETHVTSDRCFENVWCRYCHREDYRKHECKKDKRSPNSNLNISSKISNDIGESRKRRSESDLKISRHFRPWTRSSDKENILGKTAEEYKKSEDDAAKEIIKVIGDDNRRNIGVNKTKDATDNNKFDFSPKEEYTIVAIHIETFKTKSSQNVDLCQIGCSVIGKNSQKSFFRPIIPSSLPQFLDNYKMEGDLLKVLHMVNVDMDRFEFREKMEEIKEEQYKKFCVSEKMALKELGTFLKGLKNCILFAIDKETIQVIVEKNSRENIGINIKGFLTWPDVLRKFVPSKSGMELEDFYSEFFPGDMKTYSTAKDVSSYLQKSLLRCIELSIPSLNIVKSPTDFQKLSEFNAKPKKMEKNETIEVFNSFRPSVSTKMSAMKMDTLEISSDSDEEQNNERTRAKKFTKDSFSMRQQIRGLPDVTCIKQKLAQPPPEHSFLNKNVHRIKSNLQNGPLSKSFNSRNDMAPTSKNSLLDLGLRRSSNSRLTIKSLNITKSPHLPHEQDKTFKSQKSQNVGWNQSLLTRLINPSASKQSSHPTLSLGDKIGQAFQKNITYSGTQNKMFKCGLCFYKTALKEDLELHWRFNCKGEKQDQNTKSPQYPKRIKSFGVGGR